MKNSKHKLFLTALEFFPSWLAIRRKNNTSIQGKILEAILEEYDYIHKAILNYEKDFFLVSYLGKENEIIETLYTAHVGDISIENTKILNYDCSFTEDINIFKKDVNTIYLQDGYALIRPSFITAKKNIFEYEYNNFTYSTPWKVFHVWNIFDEFAWFAGLTRLKDEDNKKLCERTIASFRNRTNSTKEGLKNSIVNLSKNLLSKTEISISSLQQKLFFLPDIEKNKIFNQLSVINKDLAKDKQWDITYWQHDFKEFEYLPHEWDAPVELYQNGVGYNNSLKISTSSELCKKLDSTDVSVTAYKKSLKKITEYIQKNNIKKEIKLDLKQYQNILNDELIQYKIIASSVCKINPEEITLYGYNSTFKRNKEYLSDILLDEVNGNIKEIKNNKVAAANYSLFFYPDGYKINDNIYGTMEIYNCDIIKNKKKISLLRPNDIFKIKNGIFQDSNVKFFTSVLENVSDYTNMSDNINGMTLEDPGKEGKIFINAEDISNQYIFVKANCKKTSLMGLPFIDQGDFTYVDNMYLNDNKEDARLSFALKDVSYFEFTLDTDKHEELQGSITYTITIDGKTEMYMLNRGIKVVRELNGPSDIKVEIHKKGEDPVWIKDIKVAQFGLSIKGDGIELLKTPFGTFIPENTKEIEITLSAYKAEVPYIEFIHIGNVLNNTKYEIKNIDIKSDDILDINSNCKITLVNNTTGEVIENYSTKSSYRNISKSEPAKLFINVQKYNTIIKSDIPIYQDESTGDSYILLAPNEEKKYITIDGQITKIIRILHLSDILNDKDSRYYVNNNIDGIIRQNAKEEVIEEITREKLSSFGSKINMWKIVPQQDNIIPVFIQSEDKRIKKLEFNKIFKKLSFAPQYSMDYIAYNVHKILLPEVHGIPIVYNFIPLLSASKLVLYQIENKSSADIKFEKFNNIFESWSLGRKEQGIRIKLSKNKKNISNYKINLKTLKKTFVISNSITLDTSYSIGKDLVELAKYIIIPPNNMKVDYQTYTTQDDIIIQNAGFNKLFYSNITAIKKIIVGDTVIPSSDYELLDKEGILIWKNQDLYGKTANVIYSYLNPVSLSFLDIDDLYRIANYDIEAYEVINKKPEIYMNCKDNETISTHYPNADFITTKLSNDAFISIIDKDTKKILLKSIAKKNRVAIHNGYIYDDHKEYWFFANKKKDEIEKYPGIDFVNVKKIPGKLLFFIQSCNMIKNSSMKTSYLDTLCVVDFKTNKHLPAISSLNTITPCNSFNGWASVFMDIKLKRDRKDYSILFAPQNRYGYACLEITDYIKKNRYISIKGSGVLCYLYKDKTINKLHLRKSTFAEKENEFKNYEYEIKNYDSKSRYFIVVIGTGEISEIIIADKKISDIHKKNIDRFGFNLTEKRIKKSDAFLYFSPDFSIQNNIELDRNNYIMLDVNIDYGLTLLKDIELSKCKITNVDFKKDVFFANNEGTIITPSILLEEISNIKMLHLKINNILLNDYYKYFTVKVYTAENTEDTFKEIGNTVDNNILSIDNKKLDRYVKFKITMPDQTIIDNISLYAEYRETDVKPQIDYNYKGVLISKILQTQDIGNFKVKKIIAAGDFKDTIFKIRACRTDKISMQWTKWKNITPDKDANIIEDINFYNYNLFQIMAIVSTSEDKFLLKGIQLAVID